MTTEPKARAATASWIDPDDDPPPRGSKINLLTIGGISTTGTWDEEGCVAWAPLLTVPPAIRAKLLERYTGVVKHVPKPR